MKISCCDVIQIKNAMGKNHDLLLIEDDTMTLSWWTNEGAEKLVVNDFNGHASYFFPFIKKVLTTSEGFNNLYDEGYKEDSDRYLTLRSSHLGY